MIRSVSLIKTLLAKKLRRSNKLNYLVWFIGLEHDEVSGGGTKSIEMLQKMIFLLFIIRREQFFLIHLIPVTVPTKINLFPLPIGTQHKKH